MTDSRFHRNAGPFSLKNLAEMGGAKLADPDTANRVITDVAPLHAAGEGHISFLDNPKYVESFHKSKASACVIHEKFAEAAPTGMALILAEAPYLAYAKIAQVFYPVTPAKSGVHPQAVVASSAKLGKNVSIAPFAVVGEQAELGENVSIGAGAFIGDGVQIGANTHVGPQAVIQYAIIGTRCILHPGVRIGQDGFGFASDTKTGQHFKVPQLGRVVIGNDVEIGANTCIDRGTAPDTAIGDGCKIDNLVQIAHNVKLGKGCIVVSQVGISGSTEFGDYVVAAGQAGFTGHLQVGSGARIAAQSGIMRNVPPGASMGGSPAVPVRQWHKMNVALQQWTQNAKSPKNGGNHDGN